MKYILAIWMAVVIVLSFLVSPPIAGLGDSGRIVYFHVPCAWVGALAYICGAICGIRYLMTRKIEFDFWSVSAAQVGVFFTILATVSGAIWAQAAWGKWWNWDPRQVSIFIVLLIYGAYFALRTSVEQPEQRAVISAVYSIIAMVSAIFLIFVAIRIKNIADQTLHPAPITQRGGMEPRILAIFFSSLAGFTGLYLWMWRIQAAIERLSARRSAGV